MELDWFSPLAARAVTWTRQQLSAPVLAGLRALPAGPVGLGAAGEGILACHGSPFDEDEYLTSVADFRRAFDFLAGRHPEVRICLFGHTHVPVAVEDRGGALRVFEDGEVRLAPGGRYLLNPGSVGQPRDGNPRASFAILDTDRGAWEVIRAAYPFRETARKIAAAGLPPELGARLAAGW
jgi:diadenosine tetraphosphatase ApaH/serine/threonine PP2A family protein phosphatase